MLKITIVDSLKEYQTTKVVFGSNEIYFTSLNQYGEVIHVNYPFKELLPIEVENDDYFLN